MTTGQRISKLRDNMGMSQPQLADKLNVSQSTIAMWEAGKRNVNNQDLIKLADLFNVSTDYLLAKSDIKNPYSNNDREVDIDDSDVIMTYEGKPIPPEDIALIKRLLRGGNQD